MLIPRYWARSEKAATPSGRMLLQTWGWSDASEIDAMRLAQQRLQAAVGRYQRPDDAPRAWQYYGSGERPVREEILDPTPAGATTGRAVVTRNRFGVAVLNTARLLFIDVDLPPSRGGGPLGWLRRRAESPQQRLDRLIGDLEKVGNTTFWVYRTAAGFRALAVDREFDPVSSHTRAVLEGVGADPLFVRLCAAQACFRARLSPKPWRCGAGSPRGEHPRTPAQQSTFRQWLADYETRASAFATCAWVAAVGRGTMLESLAPLVQFHEEATGARSGRPLA
ncbi:MAG: hypothetical protein ACK5TK_03095 [Betaproteobacteria bacterium]